MAHDPEENQDLEPIDPRYLELGFDTEGNYTLRPGDPGYNAFVDPSSKFFGIDPDWEPTPNAPVPTMRCSHVREDGTECKNRALRGLGLDGGKAVCYHHGGSRKNVKAKADAFVEAARMTLLDNVPDAIGTLTFLMKSDMTADNVRLKAATEILDRSGVNSKHELDVKVEHTQSASSIIAEKLAEMSKSLDIVDEAPEATEAPEITEDGETDQS